MSRAMDVAALAMSLCLVMGMYMTQYLMSGNTKLGWSEDDIPRSPP